MNPYIAAMLKRDEGVRESAYQDSLGYWTIGVGRLIDGRKGGKLKPDEIDYLLRNDIAEVESFAARLPWFHELNEARQAVILNMLFNLGPEPFDADGYKDWPIFVKQIQAGDFDAAADNMLKTLWARQVGARAGRLAQIMRTGVVPVHSGN